MKTVGTILSFIFCLIVSTNGFTQNTTCITPAPFCSISNIGFPANYSDTGDNPQASTTNPANNYACLETTGNPAWFYGIIGIAGGIQLSISNTSNLDLNFILYGPYPNLETALGDCDGVGQGNSQNNNGYGFPSSEVLYCDDLSGPTASISIIGANAGEVFMLLVTNDSNIPTDILIEQTIGFGRFDCSILPPCAADAGTQTVETSGTVIENEVSLCAGDDFSINSNNDYTLPPNMPGETAELLYAIYNTQPPADPDPTIDVGFSNLYWPNQDIPIDGPFSTNNGGIPPSLADAGITGSNNGTTVWFVPVTVDNGDDSNNPDGIIAVDQNEDGCYDAGDPICINYLLDIVATSIVECNSVTASGSIEFILSGGAPATDGSNFTITNCGNGTLSTTSVPNNGNLVVNNLLNGDTACITVTDAFGCSETFSQDFTNCGEASCLINNSLTANPPTTSFPNDAYPPGTTVEFCYEITEYLELNCSFLQGIVPTFGDCWDITPGTEPQVTVALVTAGTVNFSFPNPDPGDCDDGAPAGEWNWYTGGITENTTGTDVGAGWFFTTSYSSLPYDFTCNAETDPNGSFGDGDIPCNTGTPSTTNTYWRVCFELTTRGYTDCIGNTDCSVSVKTYSDGEIGAWTQPSCGDDNATSYSAAFCCTDNPIVEDITVCEGENITLSSPTTGAINWYSSLQSIPQYGNPLDIGVLPTGTYTWYAEVDDNGCLSEKVPFTITVNAFVDSLSQSCDAAEAGSFTSGDILICPQGTISAMVTGVAPEPYQTNYYLTDETGLILQTSTDGNFITPAVSGCFGSYLIYAYNYLPGNAEENPTDVTALITSCNAAPNQFCDVEQGPQVTIQDTTTPVFTNPPADLTVACPAGAPDLADLEYTDNCGETGSTSGMSITDGNIITNTWMAADSCGNTTIHTQTIIIDVIAITAIGESTTCADGADGNIILDITGGGLAPFSFDWDYDGTGDFDDPQNPTGLAAGDYAVTVFDANGCAATASATVTEPPYEVATIDGPATVCPGDDATITISFSGGTAPYTIGVNGQVYGNIPNGFEFTVTPPGSYTLDFAIDANGCVLIADTVIAIDIEDIEAPVFIDPPANATYPCPDEVPAIEAISYTDNCIADGMVVGEETISGNVIVRNWFVFDAAGNSASHVQIITLLSESCIICPDTLIIPGIIPQGYYQAEQVIISDGTVLPDSVVDFRAGNCLLMNPEFEVQLGAEFEAKIDTCQ